MKEVITKINITMFLIVGLIAGWLAGKLSKGSGFGLLGNLLIGIGGAFVGDWTFGLLDLSVNGTIGSIACATVGALLILFITGKIKSSQE